MSIEDGILDPAHADDGGVENAGVAGIPKPELKPESDELKVSEDGNVAEHKGVKYVRQEALHQARTEAKQLRDTLAALDPVMPEFEQFLKVKNNRQAAVREAAASDGEQDDDAYLSEVATALGYFDETNQPDLRRAQAHLNVTRRESTRVVKREVEPDRKQSKAESARVNRERARGNKFVDGQPVAEEKYLNAAFESLGDDFLADSGVANLAQIVAAGLQYLDERKNGVSRRAGPARREPMMVEGSTGRFDGDDGELSGLEMAAARARGKSPEQWAKLSKQVNANTRGRNTAVLEEV
jgi:hypothetical protein